MNRKRKPATAEEVMARLSADPSWVARREEQEATLRCKNQEFRQRAFLPLVRLIGRRDGRYPRAARRLLDVARSHRLYALFHLALSTGARQGELLALHWSDVDLDDRKIHIQHTLSKGDDGKLRRAAPKTGGGRRQIELTDHDVRVLREHRQSYPSVPFVFSDGAGNPLEKDHLLRHQLHPLLKAAGLPKIRFHDLRHTAATLMLGANVNPKTVSERLGHASIKITLDTYSHVTPTMQREAAEKLATLLRR